MGGSRTLTIGVLYPNESARELADELADALPDDLRDRFPDQAWAATIAEAGPHAATATSRQIVDQVRRRMLDEGWDLAIALTDLPLRAGRRPVSAHANATHGVGLVSVPALGAIARGRRLRSVAVRLVEGLLGESVDRAGAKGNRERRLTSRLGELGARRAIDEDDGSFKILGAALRGNVRLLVGMVRANQPSKVIVRLSRTLFGAAGTGALSMVFADIWRLADAMAWPRLLGLAVISVAGTSIVLVFVHGLWERPRSPAARERTILFNLATTLTVTLGVATLYAGLFVASLACAAALIPAGHLARVVGHDVGLVNYLELAWFVATLATIGGALGSLVESDEAVRDAAYRSREDERTELDATATA